MTFRVARDFIGWLIDFEKKSKKMAWFIHLKTYQQSICLEDASTLLRFPAKALVQTKEAQQITHAQYKLLQQIANQN